MCFSPEVDVAAGVIVGSIGVEALRHVHHPRELPLAGLPLAFAAHQLTEAFVWWGLMGKVARSNGQTALWLYMAFAFAVLPWLAPLAVLLVEPDARRRRRIRGFAALGAFVSVLYAQAMLRGPISGAIAGHTVTYRTGVANGGEVAAAYMVATVAALMSSSHRRIAAFGAANLAALPVLLVASTTALTSLWCVWAAVASVIIAGHQRASGEGYDRATRAHPQPGARVER